uniref:Centrosomal protein 89 n=1 Tax=Gouania willdenowi TaxID=441366 RepID=A0A8C5HFM7_GOUWI
HFNQNIEKRRIHECTKHIAHGLIPAASIAPKAAVPRTPPPRSPNPSPERPRSALAAAILSSSLTGQTWALPPTRPRAYSVSDQSESFISGPKLSTGLYSREENALAPIVSEPGSPGEETPPSHSQQQSGSLPEDLGVDKPSLSQAVSKETTKGFHSVLHNLRNTLILVPAGSQAELQSLRKQAQELVDENDALKLTVHRINVELSDYQARFRPRTQQEVRKTHQGSVTWRMGYFKKLM